MRGQGLIDAFVTTAPALHDPLAATAAVRVSSTLRGVESDAELLERLRQGDEKAFVVLVGRYHGPMLRLARTLVANEAVAEEAVQETWSGVVRGIERFEGRSSVKTWLFRILVNRTRSALAQEYRSGASRDPGQALDPACFDERGSWVVPVEPWEDDAVDRLDASARSATIRCSLEGLPTRQRAVVELRDIAGLSGDEVSDLLGISRGNQRVLLHRARNALRAALESEWAEAE